MAGKDSIAVKLWLVLGGLLVLSSAPALLFFDAVRQHHRGVQHIASVAHPMSVAAFEMEINTLGAGLAVVKCLHRSDPAYLARIEEDNREFQQFKRQFQALAVTAEGEQLAKKAAEQHEAFMLLARRLIAAKDHRDQTYVAFAEAAKRYDEIVDDDRPANALPPTEAELAADSIIAHMSTQMSEAVVWVTVELGGPAQTHRGELASEIRGIQSDVAALETIGLPESHHRWLTDLRRAVDDMVASVQALLELQATLEEDLTTFVDMRRKLDDILDDGVQILTAADFASAAGIAEANATESLRPLIGVGIAALALTLAAVVLVRSRIVRPLAVPSDGAAALRRGQLDF